MRRLRISTWLLSAVLLALIARVIVSGPSFAGDVSGAFVAILLLASLLLTHRGHQLEPTHGGRGPRPEHARRRAPRR
ncbi:MAG: hypothetical protein ACXVUE_14110 [Solirubrobacteraceae bacterium]